MRERNKVDGYEVAIGLMGGGLVALLVIGLVNYLLGI